ncbi:MAG: hypothetical protein C4584_00570 [Armatimonadetes bacterium]|nr:MAG: hypothetical protein C4584_00570 [Armatimonadota bacterium]
MNKYLCVAKLTLQEYFAYRLNFFLWRFRNFVFFLTLVFFWSAVYEGRDEFLGYQRSEMLTYVFGIALLRSVVLSSRISDLAGQIKSGSLNKLILKPINMFYYWWGIDVGDKFLNIFFTIFEVGVIYYLLKFNLYFPNNYETYLVFGLFVVLGILLNFFFSFFLSLSAFWTDEIWGTRYLFGFIFLEFFAGAFFPIDVLPDFLTRIIYLTPFPYLIFFPLKIWLGQFPLELAFQALFVCLAWVVLFWSISSFVWRRAIRNYGAYGG